MTKVTELIKLYPESFRANLYTKEPFRMIGLVDVSIKYTYGIERVTLAYYRSSGTNSGKIKGLWYPIVGIKTYTGGFTEFTEYLNYVLSRTTRSEHANRGWLAKSLFFSHKTLNTTKIRGFSTGKHYEALLEIGKALSDLYDHKAFHYNHSLDADLLNSTVTSKKVYPDNSHTQKENYERFIEDIFNDFY